MIRVRHLPWLLLLASTASTAAWLGTCPGTPRQAGIKVLDTLLKPDGASITIIAAAQRIADCDMTEIPLAAERLRWAKMLNRSEADALSRGIIVKNARGETAAAAPHEIIPLQDSAPPAVSMPIGVNLLARLEGKTFGRENRAAIRQDSTGIRLECAPGQAPAGALFASPNHSRLPAGAALALKLEATTDGAFRVGVADAAREKLGEPLNLGTLSPVEQSPAFALPAALDGTSWRFWVVACPASAALLTIRSLWLEARISAELPRRALWVWEPSAWKTRAESTMKLLAGHGAGTIFITVPLTENRGNVTETAALQRFITAASALDIKVWAVIGDPRAVLPQERDQFARMAGAYAAYNRTVPPQARLSGLQLDIEPYLNSGYQLDTEDWLAAYIDTLSRVRAQAMMPLDIAVPFWWGQQRFSNDLLLDHLGKQIDMISVMNYRTERQQLIDHAEPFLEWGTRAKKIIRIGLEAGPIPDESLHVFRTSTKGDLWLMPLGDNNLLLSLDTAMANPAARIYAYSHSITRQNTNTTFNRNVGAMQKLLPELESVWRAWPSFGGIALHGLDPD